MLENALNIASSVLYLASSVGLLGVVCYFLLPEAYARWKMHKHQIDTESELYELVVDTLDKAEGRPIQIVVKEDENV